MQAETTHEDDAIDQAVLGGIESMLEVLEGNCPVPLAVRSPDKAAPPEC